MPLPTQQHGREYEIETIQVDEDTSFTLAYSNQIGLLPANGGIRWRHYARREQQESEAVMLAHSMSLKHGLYKTGFSGGKIVVNSRRLPAEQPEVLIAIGELLNRYNGRMFTGCDINTGNKEMDFLSRYTPWILNAMGNPQIDTSTATGYGVWSSMVKILTLRLPHASKPRIAIHGMGKVGSELARQCLHFGCEVVGYDINPGAVFPVGVRHVTEERLFNQASEVLCIASLSGILTLDNIAQLNTRWLVSSANSPFSSPLAEERLIASGIHYLPDYVSNAGAVICDSIEMAFASRYNQMNQDQINAYVYSVIGTKTQELLQRSALLDCDLRTLLQPVRPSLLVA